MRIESSDRETQTNVSIARHHATAMPLRLRAAT
jgi:hypothetical protein